MASELCAWYSAWLLRRTLSVQPVLTTSVAAWQKVQVVLKTDVSSINREPSFVKPISQLRFDYDTTVIQRYHDAFDYDGSDRNYDLRSIRLRYDCDTTTRKN